MPPPPRTCRSCGREITWRKKWERNWEEVRYCSSACRSRGVPAADRELEAEVRRLVGARAAGRTDLDLAAALGADLEQVRRAARRLVADGEAELRQGGRVVDPSRARGPVTVRATGPSPTSL